MDFLEAAKAHEKSATAAAKIIVLIVLFILYLSLIFMFNISAMDAARLFEAA